MNDADTALVVRARNGDRAAFEELVRRTARLVYARLYLDTGRTEGVEDLLQETYLLAFRSLHRLADPAGFRAWLLAIAHNAVIDAARRASRQKRAMPSVGLQSHLALVPSPEPRPDQAAEVSEARQKVLSVLRSLPEEYRMALTLRYITGADHDRISEQLGLTNGALRGLLHRGLKLLRDRLPPDLATEFRN